jgi:hypothetical protein
LKRLLVRRDGGVECGDYSILKRGRLALQVGLPRNNQLVEFQNDTQTYGRVSGQCSGKIDGVSLERLEVLEDQRWDTTDRQSRLEGFRDSLCKGRPYSRRRVLSQQCPGAHRE